MYAYMVCMYIHMYAWVCACMYVCIHVACTNIWHVYDAGDVCTGFNTKNILVYWEVAN